MTPRDPFLVDFEAQHGPIFTSNEVSLKTGASLRQLQWWDERNVLKPLFHHSHKRFYDAAQLVEIKRLIGLRRAGASLYLCRKLLKLKTWTTVVSARKGVVIGDVLVVP